MQSFTTREQIVETVNRLFVYTDYQEWDKLQSEVFAAGPIRFDMSSAGGPAQDFSAQEICDMWRQGFEGIDAVNHLGGNYLVTVHGGTAHVFAYATASHYKAEATQSKTRDFVGSYDIQLVHSAAGWRIDGFKYNLKYVSGNANLM